MSLFFRGNASGRIGSIIFGTCLCVGLMAPTRAQAGHPVADEVREYEVLIKSKTAGKMLTRITDFDDGSSIAGTDEDVKIESWFHSYQHDYHGREVWRGNHLIHSDSNLIDDGKSRTVHATVNEHGAVIELPGKAAESVPRLAVTTNYWHLPDMPPGTNNLAILNCEKGATETGWFKRVGAEQIIVNGRSIACTRFHVVGAGKAELWFDERARLVREQTVINGYPAEIHLTRLHENAPVGEAQ